MCDDEQPKAQKRWLRAAVVVAVTGLSRAHVYRHAADLGGRQVGRRWLFDPDVIATFERPADRPQETR